MNDTAVGSREINTPSFRCLFDILKSWRRLFLIRISGIFIYLLTERIYIYSRMCVSCIILAEVDATNHVFMMH